MVAPSNQGCVPNTQTRFDCRDVSDCAATLQNLLQAYTNLVSGTQLIVVRFGERWTHYGRGNAPAMLQLYQMLYRSCPHAARLGLPDLAPGRRFRRGPPATSIQTFPRL